MRINHNVPAMIGQGALHAQQAGLSRSLEKLSTGLRINRASDDAAGLSVSESLRAKVRGTARGKENAQDAIAMLQIAEGAAGQITDVLQRMRELAVQAANDTFTTTDRIYMYKEFAGLFREINRITGGTTYNGVTLLNRGSVNQRGVGNAASVLHIGLGGSSQGQGMDLTIPPLSLDDLNFYRGYWDSTVTTWSVTIDVANGVTYGVPPSFFNSFWVSNGTLASPATENTDVALGKIDQAIKSVNSARSTLGAYVNRLELAVNALSDEMYNAQDAESRIRDVDFASETTSFTRSQILTQGATSMLAQANQVPQGVLSLLGS